MPKPTATPPARSARSRATPAVDATTAAPVDLGELPGHHIRRLQQIAVAVFLQEVGDGGGTPAVTPVQYAALQAIANQPSLDQRTLAALIGLDTSTLASVLDRLQARGLIERRHAAADRRLRLLHLTAAGAALLRATVPAMQRAQARILAPLAPADRAVFMALLRRLVLDNNALSRAPAEADADAARAARSARSARAAASTRATRSAQASPAAGRVSRA